MEKIEIKTMLKKAHMEKGGAYRSKHFLCEHGMCVFMAVIILL